MNRPFLLVQIHSFRPSRLVLLDRASTFRREGSRLAQEGRSGGRRRWGRCNGRGRVRVDGLGPSLGAGRGAGGGGVSGVGSSRRALRFLSTRVVQGGPTCRGPRPPRPWAWAPGGPDRGSPLEASRGRPEAAAGAWGCPPTGTGRLPRVRRATCSSPSGTTAPRPAP